MKVCPETPAEDAAAPCVEAPRPSYRGLWLTAAALVVGAAGWFGLRSLLHRPPVHEPANVNLATAIRARSPVPLQAVGEITREGDAKIALVRVEIPAEQGQAFYTVAQAEIRPRAFENRLFIGTVKSTGEKDGKVILEFELDVADTPALDDGRADVTLTPPGEAPLLVPVTAVVSREGGRSVAVVDADGMLSWKVVNLGRQHGSQIEVLWGLQEGARYVQRADPTLQEGARVRAKRR